MTSHESAPSFETAVATTDAGHLLDPDLLGRPVQFSQLPRVRFALVTAAHRPSSLDTKQVPKELITFGGKPLITYGLDHLAAAGINQIVLVVAKNGESVARAVLDWAKTPAANARRVHVQILLMPTCFCHASSIVAARRMLPDEFILMAGDHVFEPLLVHRMASGDLEQDGVGHVLVEGDVRSMAATIADTAVYVEHSADGRVSLLGRAADVPPHQRSGVEAGLFLLKREVIELLIDLSTTRPYYTLADALGFAARAGQLRCLLVGSKPWLCFETLAQLQAASQFRGVVSDVEAAMQDGDAMEPDEARHMPVGEIVDGEVEVVDQASDPCSSCDGQPAMLQPRVLIIRPAANEQQRIDDLEPRSKRRRAGTDSTD